MMTEFLFEGHTYCLKDGTSLLLDGIPYTPGQLREMITLLQEARAALVVALGNTPDLREWGENQLPTDHWRALKQAQHTLDRIPYRCPHTAACRASAQADFGDVPELADLLAKRLQCGERDPVKAIRCATMLNLIAS